MGIGEQRSDQLWLRRPPRAPRSRSWGHVEPSSFLTTHTSACPRAATPQCSTLVHLQPSWPGPTPCRHRPRSRPWAPSPSALAGCPPLLLSLCLHQGPSETVCPAPSSAPVTPPACGTLQSPRPAPLRPSLLLRSQQPEMPRSWSCPVPTHSVSGHSAPVPSYCPSPPHEVQHQNLQTGSGVSAGPVFRP